jgi:hypothetical protein
MLRASQYGYSPSLQDGGHHVKRARCGGIIPSPTRSCRPCDGSPLLSPRRPRATPCQRPRAEPTRRTGSLQCNGFLSPTWFFMVCYGSQDANPAHCFPLPFPLTYPHILPPSAYMPVQSRGCFSHAAAKAPSAAPLSFFCAVAPILPVTTLADKEASHIRVRGLREATRKRGRRGCDRNGAY